MRLMWLGVLVLIVGCDKTDGDSDVEPDRVDAILALTGDGANGEPLWISNCASCHQGREAEFGDRAPAEVVDAMLTGPGGMPEFGGFSDQQLADILAYVAEAAAAL